MFNLIWNFFKTAPDAPQMTDAAAIKKKFNAMRWRVFASITIGYAFYYIIRQSYSVIKKPFGYRHADGNRYHRFYFLCDLRSWEVHQQLPGRPDEQ